MPENSKITWAYSMGVLHYDDNDYLLVIEALGSDGAQNVLSRNAIDFYKPELISNSS